MIKKIIVVGLFAAYLTTATFSAEADDNKQIDAAAKSQEEIISEYKNFVAKLPAKVRDEVIEFRKSIAAINKQKREMYKKLSQEAQNYLIKEQEYRKQLPIKQKALINIQKPGSKPDKKEK
jgi:DNA replication initiation complex subunit (GINS family)